MAEHSRALFLRSCALGIDSGCTNAAVKLSPAGTDALSDSPIVACENATYRLTCEAGDPWGCTMLGNHIGEGSVLPSTLKNQKYFSRACELDPESQGCEYAQKNMEGVRKLEAERDNSEEG